MKALGLLLLGAVAIGAIYFWNPTICGALNKIPGLDKMDLCNLGHGVGDRGGHHSFEHATFLHTHPHAAHHVPTPVVHPSTHPATAPTPAFHPTSNTIGTPQGAGVALGLGMAALNDAHSEFARAHGRHHHGGHHRMSI